MRHVFKGMGAIGLALTAALSLGVGGVAEADDAVLADGTTVPGEAILMFEDATVAGRVLASAERTDALDAEVVADDLDGRTVVVMEYASGSDAQAQALIGAADALPGVEAQPNYLYELLDDVADGAGLDDGAVTPLGPGDSASDDASDSALPTGYPNDPQAPDQYYLGPIGDGGSDSGANVVEAWDRLRDLSARSSVTVAILDSGVNLDHEDLASANINRTLAYDVITKTNHVADTRGHGTMAAGLIGATTDNGAGIAGIASGAPATDCDGAISVLPVKVFRDHATRVPTSNIIAGLSYLDGLIHSGRLDDLRVVNLSLGYYVTEKEPDDPAMHASIAHLTSGHGVLCVGAGGNGSDDQVAKTDTIVPADYDGCLAVTSLTRTGGNAPWSDYNAAKDISVPGEDILSTGYVNRDGHSAEGYGLSSGTSLSAPIASGVAALMFSACPNLAPADVIQLMRETAATLPDTSSCNWGNATGSAGALDAGAAVAKAIELAGESVDVYRLYNPYSREHLYTSDEGEYRARIADGWDGEYVKWAAPVVGEPVYRLYNPNNGDHLYTRDLGEYEALGSVGWHREGVKMRSARDDGRPIFRLWNPWMTENDGAFSHLWTADPNENDELAAVGWRQEGTAWHAVP